MERIEIKRLIERWGRFLSGLPEGYPQNLIDETAIELEEAWANPPEEADERIFILPNIINRRVLEWQNLCRCALDSEGKKCLWRKNIELG